MIYWKACPDRGSHRVIKTPVRQKTHQDTLEQEGRRLEVKPSCHSPRSDMQGTGSTHSRLIKKKTYR